MKAILCVDDCPVFRRLMTTILVEAGYVVMCARCGFDALRLIDGGAKFDIILLDLVMAPMDGNELIRQLVARDNRTPVVILSGYVEELDHEHRNKFQQLEKPLVKDKLLEAIRKFECQPA